MKIGDLRLKREEFNHACLPVGRDLHREKLKAVVKNKEKFHHHNFRHFRSL